MRCPCGRLASVRVWPWLRAWPVSSRSASLPRRSSTPPSRPPGSLDASQPEPRTAAELIDRVQIEWAALEYTVAGLSLQQLIRPGPQGWSVKDHLVHIAEWEAATDAV